MLKPRVRRSIDLIAQIGAIDDPLLRAQKAAELFGSKAGPKLAAAIKPGMTSLDDFKVTAQDAAGATDKAAQSMETTTDKIRGAFDKLAAGARDLGQQFGPALSGIGAITSALGPSLITGLQKAWDAVKNSDAVQSAAQSALDFGGTITGAAGTIIGNLTGNLIQAVITSWENVVGWLKKGVTGSVIAKAGALTGAIYSGAVAVVEKLTSAISGAWVALGSPGSGVISAALAAGEAAGGSWVAGVVGVIGTAGLALIAKVGSDALSGAAEPGGKNFADNWLASVRNHTAAGAPTLQGIGADAGGQIQTGLESLPLPPLPTWAKDWGTQIGAAVPEAAALSISEHADAAAQAAAALAKAAGSGIPRRGQPQQELAFDVGDHARQAGCRHQGMARAVGQVSAVDHGRHGRHAQGCQEGRQVGDGRPDVRHQPSAQAGEGDGAYRVGADLEEPRSKGCHRRTPRSRLRPSRPSSTLSTCGNH
jgi:hypothetical protein